MAQKSRFVQSHKSGFLGELSGTVRSNKKILFFSKIMYLKIFDIVDTQF